MLSGKPIIFCPLEDGSGLVDMAFLEDSHEHVADTAAWKDLAACPAQTVACTPT
ncbi:hypothetical protein AB0937_37815 [Streptomyces sp. NPDC047880]|uniref:hypothetical protein n=1 Tax=Streptomyces sp. NPDC047880 TaxID=3155626 RepID=UPI003454F86B